MIPARTPEGEPIQCPVCQRDVCVEPSETPMRDATCPHCGSLLWLGAGDAAEITIAASEVESGNYAALSHWTEVPRIRVDLSGVNTLSSNLLGNLVLLIKLLKKRGCRLRLVNASPMCQQVLAITKLDSILNVRDR